MVESKYSGRDVPSLISGIRRHSLRDLDVAHTVQRRAERRGGEKFASSIDKVNSMRTTTRENVRASIQGHLIIATLECNMS